MISHKTKSRAWVVTALLLTGTAVLAKGTEVRPEAPFLAENEAAMTRMMEGMTITPSGDVDADFAAMMIPHHQGAIDMAMAELRHGRNEQLRRIAQEIIVEQGQEIAAMHLALGQSLLSSSPSPTQSLQIAPSPTGRAVPQGSRSSAHGAMHSTAEPSP